jgi:hypothetical protein
VFTHKNWEYILSKEKRSKIYMMGQQIQEHLDKRAREGSGHYPYNGVWIVDQEAFSVALPMFMMVFGIPQPCFEAAMIWC